MTPRPRGRPRKGHTRMDAALDAMRQYEFDPDLVRKTVKELLDVYGEEGWFFIEECAYLVLIETIIGKGKEETKDKANNTLAIGPQTDIVASCSDMQMIDTSSLTNEAIGSEPLGNQVLGPTPLCIEGHDPTLHINEALESAKLGNEAHDPTPLCIEGHGPTLLIKEALESAKLGKEAHEPTPLCIEGHATTLHIDEALESATLGKEACDPTTPSNIHDHASPPDESVVRAKTSEDLKVEQNIQTKQKHNSSDTHEAAAIENPSTAAPPPYKLISPPPMDAAFSHLNRRPFHGWIDDDKEFEMIELTPAPLPESLRRMLNQVDGFFSADKKKRKSRWDVKPDDDT